MPPRKRKRIAFFTADPDPSGTAHAGGKGGYGTWVSALMDALPAADLEVVPCFQTARRTGRWYRLAFPLRLLSEIVRLGRVASACDAVHMTLQYRSATPREFAALLVTRLVGVPLVSDIRAGSFVGWYESANLLYRWMATRVLRGSAAVVVEGTSYVRFLRRELGIEALYGPMVVAPEQIPDTVPPRCAAPTLRLLFVGYCYEGKGVKELVLGAREAAGSGTPVHLTLIGEEHPEITAWLDGLELGPLRLDRSGRRPRAEVLAAMLRHDVFCMPTRHPAEGHPNVINEAMMTGMVIVCTRHGFLEDVLAEDCCFFLDEGTPEAVAATLETIRETPDEARRRAARGRDRLRERYTTRAVIPGLQATYWRLLELPEPVAD